MFPTILLILLITFSIGISNIYGIGLLEVKKAHEINSDKVCGDRLCSEVSPLTKKVRTPKNTDTPLGQFNLGISLDKIRCKEGYELVIKATNWHPACVKPENVDRFIEMGWAVNKTEQDEIINLAKAGYTFDVLERLGIEEINATKIDPQSLAEPSYGLSITPDFQDRQRFLNFEGFGWLGFHNVQITISNDLGFAEVLETKTTDRGDLHMPWPVPDYLVGGMYKIVATDTKHTFEITIPIAPRDLVTPEQIVVTDKCSAITFPINWSGCDLYGVDLRRIDLRFANLAGTNLIGTTLSHKDLTGVDFTSANLKGANLDGAILIGANFVNANIFDADIREADLTGTNFSYAKLFQADLTGSNLTGANLSYSTLTEAIMASVDLKGANLEGAGTWNTNLNDCYNHPICERYHP